jgi:hypothetical protein
MLATQITKALGCCALFTLLAGCDPNGRPPHGGPIEAPPCGGIAGIECPGSGVCVDDPSDECDPEAGGADCGGLCECNAIGLCVEGMVWDDSPDVCNCVAEEYDPCIATLCPVGTICENRHGQGVCVPQADAGGGPEACGDSYCAEGLVCCNASCGICTEPGGVCIQIACE